MDAADIRVLFDYNAWANCRVLGACAVLTREQFLQDLHSSFGSVRDTLAHIYGAEFVWFERWHLRVPAGLPSAAEFPDFTTLRARLTEIDNSLIDFAARLGADAASRVIQYHLMNGTLQSTPLGPMAQHVANHGTYHRGQVATMLRQLSVKPVSTDLIYYYRERASAPAPA